MWANLTAPIAISAASGDQTLIAAPSGDNANRRIAVVGFHIQVDGITNLTLKSGSTAKAGPAPQVAGAGWIYPIVNSSDAGKDYWFVCDPGAALVLNLSSAATAGGIVAYRLIG